MSLPKAYRRSLRTYTAVLAVFVLLFIASLIGVMAAYDRKIIPAALVAPGMLTSAVAMYVTAGRVAKRVSDRVLRKAGITP